MNTKRFYFLGAALLIALLLAAFLFKPQGLHNWNESYQQNDKEPYGCDVLTKLLRGYFPGKSFTVIEDSLATQLPEQPSGPAAYIFAGQGMYLSDGDIQRLLSFVENGGQAFLSAREMPYNLMFYLYEDNCDSLAWEDNSYFADTSVTLTLSHPDLAGTDFTPEYVYRGLPNYYEWSYFSPEYFCNDNSWAALGYQNDTMINFLRMPYGDGWFYLHTTPMAFTNYQLLHQEAIDYAGGVFSHLETGDIYWDEYCRTPDISIQARQNFRLSPKGPLQYVLSQPPLAWAWYLLVASALLYLIFKGKRRQRIIPVLEKNKNTSLEFVTMMGRLYFLQNNHRQLALQMLKLFFIFVRERYYLHSRDVDADFVHKLKIKSELNPAVIDSIILLNRNIQSSQLVTEGTLVDLNRLLDQFYKNCK